MSRVVWVMLIVAIAGCVGYCYWLTSNWSSLSDWALVGTAVSGVGVVIGGLGYVGVLLTLNLQARQLKEQEGELKKHREILERAADAQVAAEVQLRRQAEVVALSTLASVNVSAIGAGGDGAREAREQNVKIRHRVAELLGTVE